jgi:hypothetical protein
VTFVGSLTRESETLREQESSDKKCYQPDWQDQAGAIPTVHGSEHEQHAGPDEQFHRYLAVPGQPLSAGIGRQIRVTRTS